VARYRLGEGVREGRYWMGEEERLCRVCRGEEETWKHVWEDCGSWGVRGVRGDGREVLGESEEGEE